MVVILVLQKRGQFVWIPLLPVFAHILHIFSRFPEDDWTQFLAAEQPETGEMRVFRIESAAFGHFFWHLENSRGKFARRGMIDDL